MGNGTIDCPPPPKDCSGTLKVRKGVSCVSCTPVTEENEVSCTDDDVCCPNGFACMKPRGGKKEKCVVLRTEL